MTKAVVFVVSHIYSGSTWLSLMLGSHSAAFGLGELNKLYSRKDPRPCALCDEVSRECPYFFDVKQTPRDDIHQVMLERSGAQVLVDNSKRIGWCSHFLGESRFQRKYIHLIRDPRGIHYSLLIRQRDPKLEHWAQRNHDIREFLVGENLDHILVTYNELAEHTDETLERICRWIGLDYEAAQKEYWNFEHHGPGANGAAAAFLEKAQRSDPQFYSARRRTSFVDLRWKEHLPREVVLSIESNTKVREVLEGLDLAFFDSGLRRCGTNRDPTCGYNPAALNRQ